MEILVSHCLFGFALRWVSRRDRGGTEIFFWGTKRVGAFFLAEVFCRGVQFVSEIISNGDWFLAERGFSQRPRGNRDIFWGY